MTLNIKKWLAYGATFFCLLANPSVVQAKDCDLCLGEAYWDRCTGCNAELGFDLLIWKACVNDTALGIGVDKNISTIDFSYNPAFRIYAHHGDNKDDSECCGFGWYASATFFNNTKKKEISGDLADGFGISQGNGKINGSDKITYFEADFLLEKVFCCTDCQSLKAQFGPAGLFLDREYKSSTDLGRNTIRDVNTWYIGLKAGMRYDLWMLDCLNLFARFTGELAAGEVDDHLTSSFQAQTDVSSFRSNKSCIFGYHIQLGTSYQMEFCESLLKLRLGYEFKGFHGYPSPSKGNTSAALVSSFGGTRLGFHGVFAGFGFCF